MVGRYFYDADGELLIVPQLGALRLLTELGVIEIEPQQIAVIPRGVRFRVELPDGPSRGYICENYGALLKLPDWARSVPTDWPIRATSRPRTQRSRTSTVTSS